MPGCGEEGRALARVWSVDQEACHKHRVEPFMQTHVLDGAEHRGRLPDVSKHLGAVVDGDHPVAQVHQRVGDPADSGAEIQNGRALAQHSVDEVRLTGGGKLGIDLHGAAVRRDRARSAAEVGCHQSTVSDRPLVRRQPDCGITPQRSGLN